MRQLRVPHQIFWSSHRIAFPPGLCYIFFAMIPFLPRRYDMPIGRGLCILLLALACPFAAFAEDQPPAPEAPQEAPREEVKYFDVEFEKDLYYSSLALFFALTDTPIPRLGEKTEKEFYLELLSRALSPRFLYLEASFNPMPYFGTYVKREHPDFYDDAQISGSFNWVKAVTAGFEEPWAGSVFLGTVVDFDSPDSKDTKGLGWSGFLFSIGNYHIKENEMVKDTWREYEWKIKGDLKSSIKKLNWSYRVGAKVHENPYITDIVYFRMRRSRLDYKPVGPSLFNNSGFEYFIDLDRRTMNVMRQILTVDKKWPFADRTMAFTLALGFVWESSKKYTGPLSSGRDKDDFQIILRPNIEF